MLKWPHDELYLLLRQLLMLSLSRWSLDFTRPAEVKPVDVTVSDEELLRKSFLLIVSTLLDRDDSVKSILTKHDFVSMRAMMSPPPDLESVLGQWPRVGIFGTAYSGKSAVVRSFIAGKTVLPEYGDFTQVDHFSTSVTIDGTPVDFAISDNGGLEEFERLLEIVYKDHKLDVLVVAFAIDKPDLFDNIFTYTDIYRRHCHRSAPLILLGCKSDTRRNTGGGKTGTSSDSELCVTYQQGQEAANLINAELYLECSAVEMLGIKEVFVNAVRVAYRGRPFRSSPHQLEHTLQGILDRYSD